MPETQKKPSPENQPDFVPFAQDESTPVPETQNQQHDTQTNLSTNQQDSLTSTKSQTPTPKKRGRPKGSKSTSKKPSEKSSYIKPEPVSITLNQQVQPPSNVIPVSNTLNQQTKPPSFPSPTGEQCNFKLSIKIIEPPPHKDYNPDSMEKFRNIYYTLNPVPNIFHTIVPDKGCFPNLKCFNPTSKQQFIDNVLVFPIDFKDGVPALRVSLKKHGVFKNY